MAWAEDVERLVVDVARLWEHPDLGRLPTPAVGPAERMLELWRDLLVQVPRDLDGPDWQPFLSDGNRGLLLDLIAMRWGQVREVVRRSPKTSPHDLVDLTDDLLGMAIELCDFLAGAWAAMPTQDDDTVPRGPRRRAVARKDVITSLVRLRDQFRSEVELAVIRRAAAEVKEVRDNTRAAAGEIATGDLAQHFEKYGNSERRQAEGWRALAVVLTVGVVVALAFLVPGERSVAEVLQRGAFALPIFGLAAYLSAESAKHRKAAQWAATLRVQLLTIDLYVAPLGAKEAAEVRQLLARRAFGDVPMLASGDATKDEAAMPLSVQAVLERLLVEMRSKPEK